MAGTFQRFSSRSSEFSCGGRVRAIAGRGKNAAATLHANNARRLGPRSWARIEWPDPTTRSQVATCRMVRQSAQARKHPRDISMASPTLEFDLRSSIRTIPDYPKPGIMFRDITTLFGDARAFRRAVDELVQPWAGSKIDKVAGMEARGFILGGAVAHQVSAEFIPIRKKGKLPHKRVSIAYSLEYGLDEMEMHEDAGWRRAEKVILVDDLIATGGTAEGAVKLSSSNRAPTCSPPVSSSTCRSSAVRTRYGSLACRCARWSRSRGTNLGR